MAKAKKRRSMPKSIKISDLKFPNGLIAGKIGVSQSMFTKYLSCDFAFLMGINKWQRGGSEENFFFGACCHELLDIVYTNHIVPPTEEALEEYLEKYLEDEDAKGNLYWLNAQRKEYYVTIIIVTMYEYFQYYEDDFDFIFHEVEVIFKEKFQKFLLTGKKDGVIETEERKRLLFEHKTKTRIDENNLPLLLEFDFQNNYYILSDFLKSGKYLDGALYNVIRKCALRIGKDESLKDFGERLRITIQRDPEHYFKRYEVEYTKEQYEKYLFELTEHFKDFEDLITGKRPPRKNHASCYPAFPCDFIKACAQGTLAGYSQRKHISPELL